MYEKKKIQAEMKNAVGGGNTSDMCFICDRPKSIVICKHCGHTMKDLRARRRCTIHPRACFLMDISTCSHCKSQELLEVGLDDIPERFHMELVTPSSPQPSTSPIALTKSHIVQQPSLPPLMEPMEVVTNSCVQLSSPRIESDSIIRGQKRARGSRVVLPSSGDMMLTRQPTSNPGLVVHPPERVTGTQSVAPAGFTNVISTVGPCICDRTTSFIICRVCAYYDSAVRKYRICPRHPENKQGIKSCPECGATEDKLDEL